MRDAQSALDQMIAFSGKEIEDHDVRAILGIVDVELVSQLVQKLVDHDREGLLSAMQEVRVSGISPRNLCLTLLRYVRVLMVTRVVGWDENLVQLSDSMRETVERQSQELTELDLIRFYDTLNATNNELRWHSQPSIHLEINLLKLVELANLRSIEEAVAWIESGQSVSSIEPPPSAKSPAAPPEKKKTFWNTSAKESETAPPEAEPEEQSPATNESEGGPVAALMTALNEESIGLYNHLTMATSIQLEEGQLIIRFPAAKHYYARQVQEEENLSRLSQAATAIAGKKIGIDIELEGGGQQEAEIVDPLADPRVKTFLDRFPGKVIVDRDTEN